MNTRDYSDELRRTVGRATETGKFPTFVQYWDIYNRAAVPAGVQRFFFRTESQAFSGGYCNAAIIGGGLLIDIESDETKGTGSVSVDSLASISSVSIHAGPLPGLSISNGASLVVLAGHAAETDIGLHWVAKTDAEEEQLLQFAQCLVHSISGR